MNMKFIQRALVLSVIIGGLGFGFSLAQAQVTITPNFLQKYETFGQTDIIRDLQFGSQGPEVVILQQTLASIPGIYPEKFVTGYFGALTKKAVERLQANYSLAATGIVKGDTLKKVNELGVSGVNKVLVISDLRTSVVGPHSSLVSWKTDQPATSELYYSASPLNENGAKMVVKDPSVTTSHTIELTHLNAGTRYYYSIVAVNPKTLSKSTTMGEFKTAGQ